MDEQEVEVSFCELCGTSVPAGDLEVARARRVAGKVVGQCCLSDIVDAAGSAPSASTAAAPGDPPQPPAAEPGRDGGPTLPVLLCVLVAVIGGALYLEGRLATVAADIGGAQRDMAGRQRADSEALQDLGIRLEDVAASADVRALLGRVDALAAQVVEQREAATEREALLDQEIDGLRRALRAAEERIVDYRPLFEDLRQRHARALAVLEGLRDRPGERPPVAASGAAAPAPAAPDAPPAADDSLPAALAAQLANLGSSDPALRFEAVDVLIESKKPEVLRHLLPMAKDPDAFVRRLTVEGLREFRRPAAVDALLEALEDDDENVCDTAWRSLRDLTGQRHPFDASASKERRARAARKWREWWAGARDSFGS